MLTYVDANILIAAAKGSEQVSEKAMEILDDENREFAASVFLKLEVLPKTLYRGYELEAEFYKTFFEEVRRWAVPNDDLFNNAYDEIKNLDMSMVDALHVAAAYDVGADEFITAERPTKPIHRTELVRVVNVVSE